MALSNEEFVQNCGMVCPFCGSEDIEDAGKQLMEGLQVNDKMGCPSCGKEWWVIYTLTGYEETN